MVIRTLTTSLPPASSTPDPGSTSDENNHTGADAAGAGGTQDSASSASQSAAKFSYFSESAAVSSGSVKDSSALTDADMCS